MGVIVELSMGCMIIDIAFGIMVPLIKSLCAAHQFSDDVVTHLRKHTNTVDGLGANGKHEFEP